VIPTELTQLVEHMAWADARVWRAVLETDPEPDEPRLRELLHHVHAVQRAFLQVWRGRAVEIPEPEAFDRLAAVRDWGRGYHDALASFLAELEPDDLDRTVVLPWADRAVGEADGAAPTDLRQCLLQVTAHSTYHRGQVNARLRELGGEPPLVDFIAWAWRGRPGADWGGPAGSAP